jgi:hypothetical protein
MNRQLGFILANRDSTGQKGKKKKKRKKRKKIGPEAVRA